MPLVSYSPGAAWSGFQSWLMGQGLQYCQQQTTPSPIPTSDPTLSQEAWDNIALSVYSSQSGLTVRFLGEYQMPDGRVQQFARDIVPTSDRAATTAVIELPSSKLLSMTAILAAGSAVRGQVYVRAQAQKGLDAAATRVATLLSGYVSDLYFPTWPGGRLKDSLSGPGNLRVITGTNPVAGAEMLETVPTGARWRFQSMSIIFVTAAGGSARRVHVDWKDNGNIFLRSAPVRTQAASLTLNYQLGDLAQTVDINSLSVSLSVPNNFIMKAGQTFGTSTTNIAAGDNFDSPYYAVEEWLTA